MVRLTLVVATLSVLVTSAPHLVSAGLFFPFSSVSTVGVQTVESTAIVQPVAVGVFPIVVSVQPGGSFLASTPPASDCFLRAINLTSGCGQFLDAINANGGSLTKATIIDILKVAKTNISGDVACYNRVATFFNGGCLCDNNLIRTINNLKTFPGSNQTIPQFAKDALTKLNQAKCPPSPPPPSSSSNSSSSSSPSPSSTSPATTTTSSTSVLAYKPAFILGRRLLSKLRFSIAEELQQPARMLPAT